ncbi:MAG TPA: DeoR family transcriptional regulator [bacterium]|nr:DeoR family transcriptional regulator [bacterium]
MKLNIGQEGGHCSMELSYLVKLTLAVYRVTQKIPLQEPLRYKIREIADKILEEYVKSNPASSLMLRYIDLLQAFFHIAQQENWVNPLNFQILSQEYQKLAQKIKTHSQKSQPSQEVIHLPPKQKIEAKEREFVGKEIKVRPSFRQQKILSLLKENKQLTLSQLRKLFPQVSDRTLRRDMESFLKAGLISRKRMGRKDVLYTLKE